VEVKYFRGNALIERSSCGLPQNDREGKFGFSSNSLRSGPPDSQALAPLPPDVVCEFVT
jgi:hypothetical protein